jgi:hypothetical protein
MHCERGVCGLRVNLLACVSHFHFLTSHFTVRRILSLPGKKLSNFPGVDMPEIPVISCKGGKIDDV